MSLFFFIRRLCYAAFINRTTVRAAACHRMQGRVYGP
jgi:hypothetical protein